MRGGSGGLAVVFALVMVSSGLLPTGSPQTASAGSQPALPASGGPPRLWLQCGVFDPAAQAPPIAPEFTLSLTQGYYIVQFDGPVTTDRSGWLGSVSDVLAYLPDNAYVVQAGAGAVPDLRSHPGVRYVGLFQPGYKLDPAFGFTHEVQELSIVCFDRAQYRPVADKLSAMGAEIVSVDPTMVRVKAPGDLASSIVFIPEVQWVQEYSPPTIDNYNAARITKVRTLTDGTYKYGTDALWSYNSTSGKYEGYAGANFTGSNVDTGVDGSHPAFDGKKVAYYAGGYDDWFDYGPYDPNTGFPHGTHTAGTMLGNGAYRSSDPGAPGHYAGMAPLAGLVSELMYDSAGYYAWTNHAYISGAVVQSNSWGGGYFGTYDDSAASYDSLVRDSDANAPGNQSLTVCFSAGNEGGYGSGSIAPPSTGKNVISVGATDDSSGTSIAGFSSRGPTSDGRTKPDIVAPGEYVTSCYGYGSSTSYVTASGTSMACPVVAGSVILVNEYLHRNYGVLPSPALAKDLLINGAAPISGYSFPGNDQGWGRLDVARSLLNTTNRKIWFDDQNYPLATGMARNYIVNVTQQSELKVSLVWTDYCGTVNAAKALVNDLDLVVTAPDGSIYLGNVFSGGYSAHNGTADNVNNVEMVRIAAPASGRWVVDVKGKNVARGVQDYSLVIGGPFNNVSIARLDLTAANVTLTPADPAEGDSVRVDADIDNIGDLPISGIHYQFKVRGGDNNTMVLGQGPGSILRLDAGETSRVSENWTAVRGWTNVTLQIDPFLELTEDNKSNNDASALVLVRGYGLELSCDRSSIGVGPGETGNLSVTVHNTANTFDTFHLLVNGSLLSGWNVSVESPTIQVPFGVNRSFNVSVSPPADSLFGDYLDFRVRATSEGNSTYTRVIDLNAVVDQVFDIELSTPSREGVVLPGEMKTYPVGIRNLGNGIDSVDLAVTGAPDGWGAYLSGTSFIVQARERQNLTLTVFAPARAPADALANITIEAASGGNRTASAYIVTRVLQVTGLSLEVVDAPDTVTAGTTAEFVLKLTNSGNGPDSFNLSAKLDAGWTVELSDSHPQVRAGDFALDNLLVSVPLDAEAGEHLFSVSARSATNSSTASELEQSVIVDQYFGLELAAEDTASRVEQGNSTDFVLELNNTGNGDDSFLLNPDDSLPRSWRMTLDPSTVHVLFNGSVQIMLRVRPPSDIADGNYSFNIIGTSYNSPDKTASVRFRIELVTPPAPTPTPTPTPTPQPEPTPAPAQNRYVVWIKDHWYLSAALLVLMIAVAAGGVLVRSRRRKRNAPDRPAQPAPAEITMAPSSYAMPPPPAPLPPPPQIAWDAGSGRNGLAPADTGPVEPPGPLGPSAGPAPAPPPIPDRAAGIAPSHVGEGAPAAHEQSGPAVAGAPDVKSRPAPAERRAVDDDIDDILSKIQQVARK